MGRQARGLTNAFMYRTHVVAVCDVDKTRRENSLECVNEFYKQNTTYGKPECQAYLNYEDIIARDDIDAVCVATPDH